MLNNYLLVFSIILLHSAYALLSTSFHFDRETYKQKLLTTKSTWSPWVASDYREASHTSADTAAADTSGSTSLSTGESVTIHEDLNVTYLKESKMEKPVLRKCCNFGEELTQDGCIKSQSGGPPFHPVIYHNVTSVIDASIPLDDVFRLVFGDVCVYGRYRLEPAVEPDDEFYLLENGSLLQPAIPKVFTGIREFCMEAFFYDKKLLHSEDSVVLPLICFEPPSDDETEDSFVWILYPLGILISVPFLIFILVAHIIIAKLRQTLHGKCFICHVSCLIVAYVGLASVQLSRSLLPDGLCEAIAFIVQFAFIACFSWLTAMCLSIWRVVSNVSSPSLATERARKSFNKKTFIVYSICAWFLPVIFTLVSLVMDLTPSIPTSYIKPQFGASSCWFLSDAAALPYFYAPISFLIILNVIFFALSARKIVHNSKKETDLKRPVKDDSKEIIRHENKILKVCITLFILMGINWIMEIISWAAGTHGGMVVKSVWYITDMCNSLQGVFIFIIFMVDSEFRSLIREKLNSWGCGKSNSEDDIDAYMKNNNTQFSVTSLMLSKQQNSSL